MDLLGSDTVRLVRRDVAGVDQYGNDVMIDSEVSVSGCSVQPQTGTEMVGNEDQTVERLMVYLPGVALLDEGVPGQLGIDPRAVDGIRYRGVFYEIVGKPGRWVGLDGFTDHVAIMCRRVEG